MKLPRLLIAPEWPLVCNQVKEAFIKINLYFFQSRYLWAEYEELLKTTNTKQQTQKIKILEI